MIVTERSSLVDISAWVREKLKDEFPECKFSVTTRKFSGGGAIDVALMEAPFDVFENTVSEIGQRENGYAQLNEYAIKDSNNEKRISNTHHLTEDAWRVMKRAIEITNEHNWDHSDVMSDYFNVNYYTSFAIGKWNKKFERRERI